MLRNHPDRACINQELHLRRMPRIPAPAQVVQLLVVIGEADREAETSFLDSLPFASGEQHGSQRHRQVRLDCGRILLWERHSEAATLKLIVPAPERMTFLSVDDPMVAQLAKAPGQVLRATSILIVPTETDAADPLAESGFDADELLSAKVGRGARIWSDFKVQYDGLGRLLIAGGGLHPADMARLVQMLQELGNYRNLALLGLLAAQREAGELARLENRLLAVSADLCRLNNDDALLRELADLASAASALSARTGYRMSATAAYTEIAEQRLHALKSRSIAGFQSLEDFIERRLLPAARTCQSFERRLERVAERIERATAQLQTRLENDIQAQNSAMLASMEQSSAQQVHLQRMVEGLSFVAVSYYGVGLLGYLAKGLAHLWPALDTAVLTGLLVIPVTAGTAFFLRSRFNRA